LLKKLLLSSLIMVNSPYLYATENEPQQDWIDNFLTQLGSSQR